MNTDCAEFNAPPDTILVISQAEPIMNGAVRPNNYRHVRIGIDSLILSTVIIGNNHKFAKC